MMKQLTQRMTRTRPLVLVPLLAMLLLLAGCGQPSSPVTTPGKSSTPAPVHKHRVQPHPVYIPKPTSIPVGGPDFPAIIRMAMSHIAGAAALAAEAPTVIPWPADHSDVLFYDPQTQVANPANPQLIAQYRVVLSSPGEKVAAFSSAVYTSDAAASEGVETLLSTTGLQYPIPGAAVALADGVDATVGQEGPRQVLAFSENGWSVLVAARHRLPLVAARQVAGYLYTHVMPEPAPSGVGQAIIVVTMNRLGPSTSAAWQDGRWVYAVSDYPTTARPVSTALSLVVSMRPYSGPGQANR